jgi:hypothetical protein
MNGNLQFERFDFYGRRLEGLPASTGPVRLRDDTGDGMACFD